MIFDDVELEYEVRGDGEPVFMAHAGLIAAWFKPLLNEPVLTEPYRVVRYHRAGYAGSSRVKGSPSVANQAAQLHALMQRLGVNRAHIVGHSSGGNIVLQLALDFPKAVHSLVLMEPALPATRTSPLISKALELYRNCDRAGAVDLFLQGTCGSEYRAALEHAITGAIDQAIAGADTFFTQELPSLLQWTFGREDAGRITQPVLLVAGENSGPVHRARLDLLLAWLPRVEAFVLRGATHLLHVQNPHGAASALAGFFARHPLQLES